MTKKKNSADEIPTNQPLRKIKRSKSVEDLTSLTNQEIKELQTQITALLEQITRIKQETNQSITQLTTELNSKKHQIKELEKTNNQLIDQNNELRINNLTETNYFTQYQSESKLTNQLKLQVAQLQKDLTISQQDLKSAQRIIELRTLEPANNQDHGTSWDYWTWLRVGLLICLVYLLTTKKN